MKINLTICGVSELPEQEGKSWTHIISIWDKTHMSNYECREQVKLIGPLAKILFSFFEDTSDPRYPDAPRLEDVKRILDFTTDLPSKAKVLVHCRAGVSRSTATAYAIFCQHTALGMEMDNLLYIETLRDLVMPNRLIIQHADKILKRNGAMLFHLRCD